MLYRNLFLLLFSFAQLTAFSSYAEPLPRVRPSDKNWPSRQEWTQLEREVGGRLSRISDPLIACKKDAKSAQCFKTLGLMKNPFYIQETVGHTQTSGWFKAWDTTPSQYVVTAQNVKDVVATINFARKKNLRLVVKGGAHSYLGQSNSPDSLLLWTRKMNKVKIHKDFIPQGSKNQKGVPAATIEAGAIWLEAYDAITSKGGRYVQGGGCTTVGVGGFIQTGGFGSFSKGWGLAAANLLEAEIVTSDGKVLIVNANTNPDLFWAIKGGGGSFGVLTKITLRTYKLPPYFGAVNMSIKARSDQTFRKLLTQFFAFYREKLLNPHWGENIVIHNNNAIDIALTSQGLKKEDAELVWKPFIQWIKKHSGDFEITSRPRFVFMPAQKWWDFTYRSTNHPSSIIVDSRAGVPKGRFWWAGNDREVDVYLYGYDSAWLPKQLLSESKMKSFIQTLFDASRLNDLEIHFQKGLAGASKNIIEHAKNTAINPVVTESFGLVIVVNGEKKAYKGIKGHEPNLLQAKKGAATVKKAMGLIRSLVPNSGAYVSESDYFAENWQERAWGKHNYKRLLSIKQKYDSKQLFVGRHYVGSEFWSPDGFMPLKK